ncbi:MAG: hypothetical protein J7K75_12045 [Desulfuromonas sp.]|nr:hypothetical protein [Desulfuromonas sp.]
MRKIIAFTCLATLLWGGLAIPAVSLAEDYSFDLEEFEKKSFEWGGYTELKWDHHWLNTAGAFWRLGFYDNPRAELDRLTATLQLEGSYHKGIVDFHGLLQASTRRDQVGTEDQLDIFSAYASIKPSPSITFELGKKTFKWGTGYAWNPVGFINRPKDLNNPEDALEGYIGAGVDLIRSFPGPLQTLALTAVVLPVWKEINDDFGEQDHINLAAKLYLLYRNTDIDMVVFTGNSRSTRYGIDFSKNLAPHVEIHAEVAHVPQQRVTVLNSYGLLEKHDRSVTSYLFGLRYLTENNLTTILEFYHNDAGYSEAEMERFYQLINEANTLYSSSGDDSLFRKATVISRSGYAKPQLGRNYLYARIIHKEPFDLLYFTPALNAIINLDDDSYSLSPEAVYSGFSNWELRLRFSHIAGETFTEHGEKLNEDKLELRIRYFF